MQSKNFFSLKRQTNQSVQGVLGLHGPIWGQSHFGSMFVLDSKNLQDQNSSGVLWKDESKWDHDKDKCQDKWLRELAWVSASMQKTQNGS